MATSSSFFSALSPVSWFNFLTGSSGPGSRSPGSSSASSTDSHSLPIAHRLKSSRNVSVFRDIPYTSTSSAPLSPASQFHAQPLHSRHLLDIYVPSDVLSSSASDFNSESKSDSSSQLSSASASVPVLLYTHGGGWVRGDKNRKFRGAPGVGRTMAENGVVTVCISYRLAKPSVASMLIAPLVWSLILSLLLALSSYLLSFVVPSVHVYLPFVFSFSFFPYLYALLLVLAFVWPFFSGYVFPLVPKFARYGAYQYQQQLEDVAQAILFVRKNLKHLVPQADTDNIFLAGHSAGAHLISQLTFTHEAVFKNIEEQNRKRAAQQKVQPAAFSSSSSSSFNFLRDIRGVIAISGVYYLQNPFSDNAGDLKNRLFRATYGWGAFGCDPRILDQASPLYHLRQRIQRLSTGKAATATTPLVSSSSASSLAALPPFLVFSAESDLGLEYDANRFVSALGLSDIRHRFVNVANSSHATIASKFERHATKDAMLQFINEEREKLNGNATKLQAD